MNIQEPRISAVAIQSEPERAWIGNFFREVTEVLAKTGTWATNTAQHFAALLSALMGPAVVSAYALALWSLSSYLGWTSSFLFVAGPLSNWIIWLGIAIAVHISAEVLKRHTQPEG
jgi:hypothetical protein